MKHIEWSKIVGYAIEVFFVTNVFVFIYNAILMVWRFYYRYPIADQFLMLGVYPEPLEIPLYVIGVFCMVLFIFYLHARKSNYQNPPFALPIKIGVLAVLIFIFLGTLGDYPLSNIKSHLSISKMFFTYVVLCIAVILEGVLIVRVLKRKALGTFFIYSFIFFLVLLFTFPPRFVISGVDYSYFFGPIIEIMYGKTLYTEVTSQYGFLSVLFLSLFAKAGVLALPYLPLVVWLLLCLQYLACFYLYFRQSKSLVFSLLGLISILTINYFTVRVIPTDYPQSGALRWLPLILPAIVLYKQKSILSPLLIFCIGLLSLWMVDTGIELILAYSATAFMLFLRKKITVKQACMSVMMLLLIISALFLSINILHIIFGYAAINPVLIFTKLRQYSQFGFGMLPIEAKNYYWIFILFYFAAISFVFRKRQVHEDDTIVLFVANCAFFAGFYYIGRSHPAELYTISLMMLFMFFVFFGNIYRHMQRLLRQWTLLGIFIFFIMFPAYFRQDALAESIEVRIKRLRQGAPFIPELNTILDTKYEKEISLIKREIKEKEAVIISGDDTYLFYKTNKHSMLYDNSLVTILTKDDLEFSMKKATVVCPAKIAGECRLFKSCPETKLFSNAYHIWQPLVLSYLEAKCQGKYEPTICTNQICIAKKNKL